MVFITEASAKLPEAALQVPVVTLPPIVPARLIVPPAHTVWAVPALAVAAWFTVIVTVDVAATHGPLPSGSFVVKVSITVPLEIEGV